MAGNDLKQPQYRASPWISGRVSNKATGNPTPCEGVPLEANATGLRKDRDMSPNVVLLSITRPV